MTPPISRAVAPLIGINSASGADERAGFDEDRLAGFFAAFLGALRAAGFRLFFNAFFDFFAMRQVLAQNASEAGEASETGDVHG